MRRHSYGNQTGLKRPDEFGDFGPSSFQKRGFLSNGDCGVAPRSGGKIRKLPLHYSTAALAPQELKESRSPTNPLEPKLRTTTSPTTPPATRFGHQPNLDITKSGNQIWTHTKLNRIWNQIWVNQIWTHTIWAPQTERNLESRIWTGTKLTQISPNLDTHHLGKSNLDTHHLPRITARSETPVRDGSATTRSQLRERSPWTAANPVIGS